MTDQELLAQLQRIMTDIYTANDDEKFRNAMDYILKSIIASKRNVSDGGGGGGGNVESVNGDEGPNVVLTASDVNADPVGSATDAEVAAKAYADAKIVNGINAGVTDSASSQDALFTALAGKETAGAAATAQSNAQAYADGKVENVITPGVTTKAPSEAAVSTALAGKADLVAGKIPVNQIPETHYKGSFTSLVALQTAFPTASLGDEASVDPGGGTNAVKYLWDAQEGWVVGSGGTGVTSFATRSGPVVPVAGDYSAALISNNPSGGIGSTTVQGALNELDAEKANISAIPSSDETDLALMTSMIYLTR